ncbi:MAG: TldD/PmbA family protein [Metallosphaera yellowstonensis]|jgi:TldD protein|uniref:Putative Zn-dependent protease-like protein n=1 Tax=Metallosphaera yellowstonensis MK1 TaxID=671065 RepID=H2C5G6_9CREN|nr:TldD/PmbA family protein [Metallosphaera yellowstonensis]EHP69043.1 putative Zn-dependent protease-like protein [Metallosphaera yellowstonensis MK1]
MLAHEDDLLRLTRRFPYSYVETRYHKISSRVISLLNGELLGVYRDEEAGYSVRYLNGPLYFVASRDPDDLRPTTEKHEGWEPGLWDGEPVSGSYSVEEKQKLDSQNLEEKISSLRDISREVLSQDIRSKINNLILTYSESVEEKELVINGSSLISGRVPRVLISFNLVMTGNGRTITAWFELGQSGGLESLNELRVREHLIEKVKSLDHLLQSGRSVSPGRKDVILSSVLSGIMAHESVGHPFEADRVLGREFAQAGTSYMAELGLKRIGSEMVNVADDPTVPKSTGFFLIDDEGVRARRKLLIKNGEPNEFLHDRFTAPRFNYVSNGSARASGFDREPLVRMSNTFFLPGEMSFQELLEDVKEGIFFKSYMEWNIDDMRLGQRYTGLEAYHVKSGEIGEPVLFPILEGTTNELLSSVDAVDDSLQFFPGTCGKGDPDQGIPVWLGGPDMRLRNVPVKVI